MRFVAVTRLATLFRRLEMRRSPTRAFWLTLVVGALLLAGGWKLIPCGDSGTSSTWRVLSPGEMSATFGDFPDLKCKKLFSCSSWFLEGATDCVKCTRT